MLDANLKAQLKAYLERVKLPFEITASLDASAAAQEMLGLLQDIISLSDKITLRTDGTDVRKPSFTLNRIGEAPRIRFAAIPMGHEFTSLVLALNLMAVLNPRVQSVVIDGGLYQKEVTDRQIMAVPMVFLNGELFGQGRMDIEAIVAKLDSGAAARDAVKLNAKDAYDVLIVGGGPAGAAAAVYAARKGIRTGVLAERFGGQTLDTLGIENFISVLETDGPKFAMALEQHAKRYGVEILNLQRAEKLVPAADKNGLIGIELANGATLKSRTMILSTGARWREVNVPGEQEYRNKGVAYCPHCDGPLFKGKRVAVIGGGNSGVEAAIDPAGIVGHVTLLEFGDRLRADAVLISKLKSLPNVAIHTQAQTTEITGADGKVNGLRYTDRASGEARRARGRVRADRAGAELRVAQGPLELSRHAEIVVDARGQTSLPGVFAAGDVTTVPFKQIIIATGDGAKPALGAFDHLIRASAPEPIAA